MCAKARCSSGKVLPTLSTDLKRSRLLSKNKVDYLVISVLIRMIMFLNEKEQIKKRLIIESFFYLKITVGG